MVGKMLEGISAASGQSEMEDVVLLLIQIYLIVFDGIMLKAGSAKPQELGASLVHVLDRMKRMQTQVHAITYHSVPFSSYVYEEKGEVIAAMSENELKVCPIIIIFLQPYLCIRTRF